MSRRPEVVRSSVSGYMTAAAATAAALFFVLWWMLQGEDSPWIPAGLAASVVMLVAAFARLLVARRVRARHRDYDMADRRGQVDLSHQSYEDLMQSRSLHAAALRALQKQSAVADAQDSPDSHRQLYDLCSEYLTGAERALQTSTLRPDGRLALRTGVERVRELQKHHLLIWARDSARTLTHEAQKRARLFEKVEVANRALECIDSALKLYPDEEQLRVSGLAVREFITSSRVAHWVELAERAAFKGYYQRAIDCYRDALYYLTRDRADAVSEAAAERITREIELLRVRMDSDHATDLQPKGHHRKGRRQSG
jgi:tetratricopeptide (TPR) repeat protein